MAIKNTNDWKRRGKLNSIKTIHGSLLGVYFGANVEQEVCPYV